MSIKNESSNRITDDGVYGPLALDVFAEHSCYVSPDKLAEAYDNDEDEYIVGNYDTYEIDDIEDVCDRVTDQLMNCDCEEQVEVVDSYIVIDEDSKEPMLNTIFMCSGCGNQVRVEAPICDIYDIDIYGTKRE